jgi:modulator of FtsH protease
VSNYDAEPWHELFVATAGAGAALAGLVFVAVSINIAQILQLRGAPERGLQTVLLLLGSVVVSVFGLVPQPTTALAVETVGLGAALLAFFAVSSRQVFAGTQGHPWWIASRLLTLLPGSAAYVVGGISLLIGWGGGLAWFVAGIVSAFLGAIVNAWVLLVEILR